MPDITALDDSVLAELMMMYHNDYHKYKAYPDQISPKEQGEVRRNLEKKFQKNFSDFPEEIKTYLSNCTDSEFFDFLKNGIEERKRRAQIKRIKETEKFASFGEEVQSTIWEIMHGFPEHVVELIDDSLKIEVRSLRAYSMYLILRGVSETSLISDRINTYDMKFEYSEDEKEFFVTGQVFLPSDEKASDFRITFTSAEIECRAYNPMGMRESGPWTDLMSVCDAIFMKYESAPRLLNEKEKELLPYILGVGGPYIVAKGKATYTTLLELSHKYGHRKTEKILARLANENVTQKERSKALVKLMLALNRISHVKMWREIYDVIFDSQKEYPIEFEAKTDAAELAAKRERICKLMAERGYTGTYPCFVKEGKRRGLHFTKTRGMINTAFEKRMQSRVYFAEYVVGEPSVMFLSGGAFLKKNETDDEFFSFMFYEDGRRYFEGSGYVSFADVDIEKMVDIATKEAELKKLTTDEFFSVNPSVSPRYEIPRRYFFLMWLIWFGLIGIMLILAMSLLTLLCVLVFCLAGWTTVAFSEFMVGFPWLKLVLVCFAASGGSGAILTTLAYFLSRK